MKKQGIIQLISFIPQFNAFFSNSLSRSIETELFSKHWFQLFISYGYLCSCAVDHRFPLKFSQLCHLCLVQKVTCALFRQRYMTCSNLCAIGMCTSFFCTCHQKHRWTSMRAKPKKTTNGFLDDVPSQTPLNLMYKV